MRQTFHPSLANDGRSIGYIVRDGGYPYAVQCAVTDNGLGEERPITLPVTGPVTRVLHSPDGQSIACEVSPRGSERTMTFIVHADDSSGQRVSRVHSPDDVKTTAVEWDGTFLAMDAVTGDGVTEARSVNPRTNTFRLLDRRHDSMLVAAEGGHALMRVGPRGSRELLLVFPDGRWLPLLPPDPGSMTEKGVILPVAVDDDDLSIIIISDHEQERSRLLRLGVKGEQVTQTELLASADADVEEFVISEDCSTVAALFVSGGVTTLEVASLDEQLNVTSRREVELPGMVAFGLTLSGDGSLLAVTVEGPNLPPTVEVLHTGLAVSESLDPQRTEYLLDLDRQGEVPELVRYTARDGLELSGWWYPAANRTGPGAVYIHLHGGPQGQARPEHHDILQAVVDSGISVFTPNVRGSLGSGRSFHHADDRYGRMAAARDVSDTARFLVEAELADAASIAVGGRSYGGYLSLLVGSLFPGQFAAIVDACGMTSFKTYFARTEPWLASAAYPEYGYPMHDKELLDRISPLTLADNIDSPAMFLLTCLT